MTPSRPTWFLPLLLGCKGPPEAPAELDELCGFIYSHHADDDLEPMQVALENLNTWLSDNWEEGSEDYEVSPLEESVADALDEEDRSVQGLVGLAVATSSIHTVDQATYAMVGVDEDVVYPDMFSDYSREFYGDPDCFLDHDCARLEASEHYISDFSFVVTDNQTYNQYLWVETSGGWSMVHRNWLVEPPIVEGSMARYVEVDEQYYLNLFLARGAGFWRLQTTWMVFTNDFSSMDAALTIAANSMTGNSETLDEYLDEEFGG